MKTLIARVLHWIINIDYSEKVERFAVAFMAGSERLLAGMREFERRLQAFYLKLMYWGFWGIVLLLIFTDASWADHQNECFTQYHLTADIKQCQAEADIQLDRFMAENSNLFSANGIIDTFQSQADQWITPLVELATIIFWSLAAVGMVFTFIPLVIRGSDLQEFGVELLKTILIIAFGSYLLSNYGIFFDLIQGFRDTAAITVTGSPGTGTGLERILLIPFIVVDKIFQAVDGMSIVEAAGLLVCGAIVLYALATASVQLVVVLCEMYIVVTVGLFSMALFSLGFTRDYTLRFFGAIMGTGFKLLAIDLIISLGLGIAEEWAELPVLHDPRPYIMMAVTALLYKAMVTHIPNFIQSVISGIPGSGISAAGAVAGGMAVGGAAVAATKATTGGVMSIQDAAKMAKTAGATGVAGVAMGTARNLAGAKLDNIRRDSPMAAQMREARFAAQADKAIKSTRKSS